MAAAAKQKSGSDGDADLRSGNRVAPLSSSGALRGDESKAQIVSRGQAGIEQADDGESDGSSADCGSEGVELAEEAAGEGNADERDEEEDEQAAEQRRAIDEAAEIVDERQVLVVSADQGDDGEDADVHGGVGGGVESWRRRCRVAPNPANAASR